MKKVLMFLFLMPLMTFAEEETVDGIRWTYTVSEGSAHIGGVTDHWDPYNSRAISSETSGAIMIPSTLGGFPVMSVKDYAFYKCSRLTSVKIPLGVMSIGESAFDGCSGLTSVIIPATVTRLGACAFSDCVSLGSLVLPDSVTTIGAWAFERSGLTSMVIPSGVSNIGMLTFYQCDRLTSVQIPFGVTSIGYEAFADCESLKSVTVPSSVTNIAANAFRNCNDLTDVNISDLSAWCGIEFGSASANPLSYVGKLYLEQKEVIRLSIPNGVEKIGRYAFCGCGRLVSVTMPPSIKSVGVDAFLGCSELKVVNITDLSSWCGIEFDSSTANPLYYAGKVQLNGEEVVDLMVPEGVTSIGSYTFAGSTGIKTVVVPCGVQRVGVSPFYGCCGIISVTTLGAFVMYDIFPMCYSSLKNVVVIGEGDVAGGAFKGCCQLESLVIEEGVERIREDACSGCSSLKEVTIPSTVTSIGGCAFYGCSSLKVIHVSNNGDMDAVKQMLYESGFDVVKYFDVVFNPKGGTSTSEAVLVRPNSTIPNLPTAMRENYEFLGWFTEEAGGEAVTAGTIVTRNMILYAHWRVCSPQILAPGEKVEWDMGLFGYAARGLPNGLSYNKTSGMITGAATKLGEYVVKFTKGGAEAEEMTIIVTEVSKVIFDANDGAGTSIPPIQMEANRVYKLPKCKLTPPDNKKRFAGWAGSNGKRYDDEMLVFDLAKPGETIKMTAIWE